MLYKLKESLTSNYIDIIFDINLENIERLEKWIDENRYDPRFELNHPAS